MNAHKRLDWAPAANERSLMRQTGRTVHIDPAEPGLGCPVMDRQQLRLVRDRMIAPLGRPGRMLMELNRLKWRLLPQPRAMQVTATP